MNNFQTIHAYMSNQSFWQCINLFLLKPHVVNKRLWGHKILSEVICKPCEQWNMPPRCARFKELNNLYLNINEFLKEELKLQVCSQNGSNSENIKVLLVELFPKVYSENHAVQLICINHNSFEIAFYNVTPQQNQNLCPEFPYMFQLSDGKILLRTHNDDVQTKSYQWLLNTVTIYFGKWDSNSNNVNKQMCNQSLNLVSSDKYYNKYNELKLKYGKEMVKIWPECTDPTKFVYEDVAIATYLLLLWETESRHTNSSKFQTFADLGCGNGLLVYILTMEGHSGIGIDVRKRQIWDSYPHEVKLKVQTITPFVDVFSETDWIIGNHSDELTPWIPVIAARSSYKCNFFLLPCCAYNFDGSKYQRKNSSKSQYNEYLEYVRQLCLDLGFNTDIDRLKIPSTKRICLVSRSRTYVKDEYCKQNSIINYIINAETSSNANELSIENFKARDPVEKVRNCTQLETSFIETLVNIITNYLLEGCSLNKEWHAGKLVEISELAMVIPQDSLKILKSECGGLQTLLKNNHHIFKVQSGKVQLRYPKTVDEINKHIKNNKVSKNYNPTIRQKPCWFHFHHPQGCPLTENDCSYLHGVRS